jgi:hypothetical protein
MYQMLIKFNKCPYYFPNGHKICISTFSNLRPSKIYPNWDFWLENKPSGNPEQNFARCFCNFPEFDLLQLGSSAAAKLWRNLRWSCGNVVSRLRDRIPPGKGRPSGFKRNPRFPYKVFLKGYLNSSTCCMTRHDNSIFCVWCCVVCHIVSHDTIINNICLIVWISH